MIKLWSNQFHYFGNVQKNYEEIQVELSITFSDLRSDACNTFFSLSPLLKKSGKLPEIFWTEPWNKELSHPDGANNHNPHYFWIFLDHHQCYNCHWDTVTQQCNNSNNDKQKYHCNVHKVVRIKSSCMITLNN